MDLCLNVISEPVAKKSTHDVKEKTKSTPKFMSISSDNFDVTWNKNKNIKAKFVRKKPLKRLSNKAPIINTDRIQENSNSDQSRKTIKKPKIPAKKNGNIHDSGEVIVVDSDENQKNTSDDFAFTWSKKKTSKALFLRKKNENKIPTRNKIKIPDEKSIGKCKNNAENEKISGNDVDNEEIIVIDDDLGRNKTKFKKIGRESFEGTHNKNGGFQSDVRSKYHLFGRFRKEDVDELSTNDVKPITEHMFSSSEAKFEDLDIHRHTVTNLARIGIQVLTAVQEKTIPEILAGRNVFVRSQTGSGKTLSYAVPLVERLQRITPHLTRQDGVQAIIIVPTRELALQTYELLMALVQPFRWLVPGRLCGGEKRSAEKARLRRGLNILVGTPGRLLDHVQHTRALGLDKISTVVLDEADRLLDMGFQADINTLIQKIDEAQNCGYDPMSLLKSHGKADSFKTSSRQTILLSATLTSNVQDLAKFTMADYVYIDPLHDNNNLDLNERVLPARSEIVIPESVKQKYVVTDAKARLVVLSAYIIEKVNQGRCKMLIFMASKQMVEYHELLFKKCLTKRKLNENKEKSALILLDEEDSLSDEDEVEVIDVKFFKLHGSMDQKERVSVFNAFREANNGVLLCTDVAARGIDVANTDYVVQYTGPLQDEDYVHRVGRTGRAGHVGHAMLFLTEPELAYVTHLQEKKYHLSRVRQDHILKSLMDFMDHMRPSSVEVAAEFLQRRYEKAVAEDEELLKAACLAFSSWSRYYSSYPAAQKKYFNFHTAHLGHYVTSFAIKKTPIEVSRYVRQRRHLVAKEKKLNKRLDNHKTEEEDKKVMNAKPKKRKRAQELLISEFDSGLPSAKKKN